jgi:hypothetical protein
MEARLFVKICTPIPFSIDSHFVEMRHLTPLVVLAGDDVTCGVPCFVSEFRHFYRVIEVP